MKRRNVAEAVRAALAAHGRLTIRSLARLAGAPAHQVSELTRRWRTCTPRKAYIAAWTREADARHPHLVPVLALGDKPDASKPAPLTRQQTNREAWQRRRQRIEMFAPGADLQRAWMPK